MDVHRVLDYAASPEVVFGMLCDERFREKVCEETRAIEYDVSVSERDGGAHVRVRRLFPALVPEMARRFVGDTIEMIQQEQWGAASADGRRTASVRMEIPGKPGQATGRVVLEPHEDGTRETIDVSIRVSVPLVGGKLEDQVARAIKAAIKVEGETGREWLDRA